MTDLRNGILKIDGHLLTRSVSPDSVTEKFGKYVTYQKINDSFATIYLDDVLLFGVKFELMLSFKNGILHYIKLESRREKMPWEKAFELDCLWLKEQLGEPDHVARTDVGSESYAARYSNTYYGKGCVICSSYENDLRCGEDASITIKYEE